MSEINLSERKKTLNQLLKKIKQELRKMPPGRLRIRCGPPARYYQVLDSSNRCGRYINREDIATARALAQKAYLQELKETAEQELLYISGMEKTMPKPPERVYATLSEVRRNLVEPFFLSDEEYAEEWMKTPFEAKGFLETDPFFMTNRGERVRSKSEILIANLLYELGVPYRYEAPLFLEDGSVIHPDFTILKPHSRQICYFEHCGRMDDPVYLHGFMRRENTYIQNGLIPGRDVFMSFETASDPLNTISIRQMIQALFVDGDRG
ncbi:MAG: hypothetical protein J5795_07855 [Lachnospiraceae bacterium]|nr:hypothetical protein [Lachnospiraceae bacterium]